MKYYIKECKINVLIVVGSILIGIILGVFIILNNSSLAASCSCGTSQEWYYTGSCNVRCYTCGASWTSHNYSSATCTSPRTCSRCGATSGSSLGHSYSSATCTRPRTCSRCGRTSGSSLGHSYSSATCTSSSTCSRCGATGSSALGHNYSSATCTRPRTCSRCGATSGSSLGHNYSGATCTSGGTCSRCGATSGSALGHDYSDATCTSPSTCSRCGATSGSALGHDYSGATCTSNATCARCGETGSGAEGHTGGTHNNNGVCTRCSVQYQTHGKSNVIKEYSTTATEHTPIYKCTYNECEVTFVGIAAAHSGGTRENGGICQVCNVQYQTYEQGEEATTGCNIIVENGIAKCTKHNSTQMAGRLYAISTGENFNSTLTNQTYTAGSGLREPDVVTGDNGTSYDGSSTYLNQLTNILGTGYNTTDKFKQRLQEEYNEIVKSVYLNKGFYVGRYETSNITTTDGNAIRVKAGVIPSENINWYYMYAQQKDYAKNKGLTGTVGSAMLQGAAYDQVMKFVNTPNYNVTTTGYALHNRTYSDGPWQTGGLNYVDKTQYKDITKNIYDLEGNVVAMTTEAYNSYLRVYRGGVYDRSDSASIRGVDVSPNQSYSTVGTLCQIYVK